MVLTEILYFEIPGGPGARDTLQKGAEIRTFLEDLPGPGAARNPKIQDFRLDPIS